MSSARVDSIPLSYEQHRVWLFDELYAGLNYRFSFVFRITGQLDLTSLSFAFSEIIRRHEILRTAITGNKYLLRQKVTDASDFVLADIVIPDKYEHEVFQDTLQNIFEQPFDLSSGKVIRVGRIGFLDGESFLWVHVHEIAFDRRSMQILRDELVSFYKLKQFSLPSQLEPVTLSYGDYAIRQRDPQLFNAPTRQQAFWKQNLSNAVPLDMPTDFPRKTGDGNRGRLKEIDIEAGLADELRRLSEKTGTTLFVTMLSVFKVVLYSFTRREEIVVATVMNTRSKELFDRAIGNFGNPVVLRSFVNRNMRFIDLLNQVSSTVSQAQDNPDVPPEMLGEKLLRVIWVPETGSAVSSYHFEDAILEPVSFLKNSIHFDLYVELVTEGPALQLSVNYAVDLYTADTIDRLFGYYQSLLGEFVADCHQLIADSSLFPAGHPATAALTGTTVVRMFERQVRSAPDAMAVICGNKSLTYHELNEWSNRLSHYLRSKYEIRPDDLVAIKLERSEWLIVVIMGILKSGGAYLPIDVAWPEARIKYVTADSGAKVVIDKEELAVFIAQKEEYEKDNQDAGAEAGHLAYCIYTSGSTGMPKGCLLEHGSLVNRLEWMQKEYPLSAGDTILQKTTYSFDVSVWELLWWPLYGARVCMLEPGGEKDPESICDAIIKYDVTVMHFVPSMLSVFLEYLEWKQNASLLQSLRQVYASGEALTAGQVNRFLKVFPQKKLMNLYGPTEATIDVSYFDCSQGSPNGIIPIGKPISNTQLYILGKKNSLLPVDFPGEICIGGVQLARGYLNRPDLTAERFVKNPFGPGRIYRTGDLGRWMRDGNIEYLGRMDHQVKIRGYRIELGEIDNTLLSIGDIKECATIVKENGDEKLIVSFVVCDIATFDQGALIDRMRDMVPSYMLPSAIVPVDSLPVTQNGKLDRAALSKIALAGNSSETYVAPQNSIQEYLAGAWQEIMGLKRFGINDNLFLSGGHSLKIIQLKNRIGKDLNIEIGLSDFFEHPTIAELSRILSNKSRVDYRPIPLQPVKDSYPVSSGQYRIWLLSQSDGGGLAYNVSGTYLLNGQVDFGRLAESFNHAIALNEILRTNFRTDDQGELRQFIRSAGASGFTFRLESMDEPFSGAGEAGGLIREETHFLFDLGNDSLIRAKVLQFDNNCALLICTLHHIICDAWSLGLLVKSIIRHYEDRDTVFAAEQKTAGSVQYKEYACWQQQQLAHKDMESSKRYWQGQLRDFPEPVSLPFSLPRPAVKKYKGNIVKSKLDQPVYDGIRRLKIQEGVTTFMLLLSGVKALLYRYTGQQDIILGSPLAGRTHPDLNDHLGFFLNTLFFRTQIDLSDSLISLTAKVKQAVLDGFKYQDYPFDNIVRDLNYPTDRSRSPVFDIMVVYIDEQLLPMGAGYQFKDWQVKAYDIEDFHMTSKFDLLFTFREYEGGLNLELEYDSQLFDEALANRIVNHTENLFRKLVLNPLEPICKMGYLTEPELSVLQALNNTSAPIDPFQSVIGLLEESVSRSAAKTALVFKDNSYTYEKLNRLANQCADLLSTGYGVTAGTAVGVLVPRSGWSVIAMLGVMKLGATYVPLDESLPEERIRHMLLDSGVTILMTDQSTAGVFNELNTITGIDFSEADLDLYSGSNPGREIQDDSVSYIIYTSGTSGKPKGVEQTYLMLHNLIEWNRKEIGQRGKDRHLQFSSFGFDMSLHDVFLTLVTGGGLYIIDRDARNDLSQLKEFILDNGITRISMTNTLLQSLFSTYDLQDFHGHRIDTIISAGDQLLITGGLRDFMEANEKIELYNYYGPSETHIVTGARFSFKEGAPAKKALIGKPISNTQLYILDAHGHAVFFGMRGEIHVGGMVLAKGYKNSPLLTDQKFRSDLPVTGDRLYKTGDWGLYHENGEIEYLGRADNQVKISGNRIELEEIKNVLLDFPGIDNALVILQETEEHDNRIVAFYTCSGRPGIGSIKKHLSLYLPKYMLPAYLEQIPVFPLNANGKIDQKSLLASLQMQPAGEKVYEAPRSPAERIIIELWEKVLDGKGISRDDDFFSIGGNSLTAMVMIARLNKLFRVHFTLSKLYEHPTVEGVATFILTGDSSSWPVIGPAEPGSYRGGGYTVSPGQEMILIFDKLHPGQKAGYVILLSFLIDRQLDIDLFRKSLDFLVQRHEILRTSFHWTDEGIFQRVHTDVLAEFLYEDVSGREDWETYIGQGHSATVATVSDLEKLPLFSASLFRIPGGSYKFLFFVHHIIFDAWSAEVVRKELAEIYAAFLAGRAPVLGELSIQYKDYAHWYTQLLDSGLLAESLRYWTRQFAGATRFASLPADFSITESGPSRGGGVASEISGEQLKFIDELCAGEGVSVFTFFFSCLSLVVADWTASDDFIIGVPSAGRFHENLENQIGYYVNMLPIRVKPDETGSFINFMHENGRRLAEGIDHQVIPYTKILEQVSDGTNGKQLKLFNVVINMINADISAGTKQQAAGMDALLKVDPTSGTDSFTKNDLTFHLYRNEEALLLFIAYSKNLFGKETMLRISRNIEQLINEIRKDQERSLSVLLSSLGQPKKRTAPELVFNLDLDV